MDTLELWEIIRWMSFLFCHLHWTIESPEVPENPKKNFGVIFRFSNIFVSVKTEVISTLKVSRQTLTFLKKILIVHETQKSLKKTSFN